MGLAVLLALVLLGRWIWNRQFDFNPAVAVGVPSAPAGRTPRASLAGGTASPLSNYLPDVFAPLSPLESFGPEDLADKIDGRAELYLSSGFVRLDAQRFARVDDPSLWMEVYVYDMGSAPLAFAVHSAQPRDDSESLDLAPFARGTPNALFLVHGRYYLELIGSAESEALRNDMIAFARNLLRRVPADSARMVEPALFPRHRLDEDSIMLLASDGLGFDRFDRLFTATYREDGAELTAFLGARDSAAEAAALAKAFADYLLENGGTEEEPSDGTLWARVINMFGTYDIVFSRGRIVAGVHQAESRELAEILASRLYSELPAE